MSINQSQSTITLQLLLNGQLTESISIKGVLHNVKRNFSIRISETRKSEYDFVFAVSPTYSYYLTILALKSRKK